MRLFERNLSVVYIAKARQVQDEVGGVSRGFETARRAVRASVLPVEGDWVRAEGGMIDGRRLRLLLPLDAGIGPGDGVAMEPGGEVIWLCRDVRRWSAHLAADFERVVGA